jgi:hypothetical protein
VGDLEPVLAGEEEDDEAEQEDAGDTEDHGGLLM